MQKIHVTLQFFRQAALRVFFFSKKQKKKTFLGIFGGMCGPNLRSVSFFVWSGRLTQSEKRNRWKDTQVFMGEKRKIPRLPACLPKILKITQGTEKMVGSVMYVL